MLKAERQSDLALETGSRERNVTDHSTKFLFRTCWWLLWGRQPTAMTREERPLIPCPAGRRSPSCFSPCVHCTAPSSSPWLGTSALSLTFSSLRSANESSDAYRWSPQAASFSIPKAILVPPPRRQPRHWAPAPHSPRPSADSRHSDLSGA